MNEDDVVPEKLVNPINYKIIGLIGILVVGFHISVNIIEESDALVYGFSMIIPAALSAFSFVTAKRYAGTLVYSKAYKMLGIAFIGLFLGELTYFVYEQFLEIDPYPSIADIFFYLFYPMTILYLTINIRFFSPKINKLGILTLAGIPFVITATYVLLTVSDEVGFDFFYGVAFVAASSTSLGFAIHTFRIFKGGLIGTSWLILVIGIILIVAGDTWYYYIEIFETYSLEHIVNLFWYGGQILILYSLYKHKKAL
jgi:hypothetical protein